MPPGTPDDPPPPRTVRVAPPEEVAARAGVATAARHLFVCTGPACCDREAGEKVWGAFLREIRRFPPETRPVLRTRCACLGVCTRGPVAVVYPEGTWYCDLTPASAARVAAEHLLHGRPVTDHVFATGKLSPPPTRPPTRPDDGPVR